MKNPIICIFVFFIQLHSAPISVTIKNPHDEKEIIIPTELVQYSKPLSEFSKSTIQSSDGSGPATPSTQLNWIIPEKLSASSEDLQILIEHLHALNQKQQLAKRCQRETVQTNIIQLKLADYFDIESLYENECNEIIHKMQIPQYLNELISHKDQIACLNSLPRHLVINIINHIKKHIPYSNVYIQISPQAVSHN